MDRIYDILNDVAKAAGDRLEDKNKDQQLNIQTPTKAEENEENESPEMEMQEYKEDFYGMSVASIRAIANHAMEILNNLENPMVKENLTESWLQGRIAITEDYMRTIHDYIMYTKEEASKADSYNDINQFELGPSTMKNLDDLYGDDEENTMLNDTNAVVEHLGVMKSRAENLITKITEDVPTQTRLTETKMGGKICGMCQTFGQMHDFIMNVPLADDDKTLISSDQNDDTVGGSKPGLWDNIRKKKERMGKKYKPAKPGDKDRPDPDQWKKLTK